MWNLHSYSTALRGFFFSSLSADLAVMVCACSVVQFHFLLPKDYSEFLNHTIVQNNFELLDFCVALYFSLIDSLWSNGYGKAQRLL